MNVLVADKKKQEYSQLILKPRSFHDNRPIHIKPI